MKENTIDIINNGISDGKYFLDDSKPYKAILSILSYWSMSILFKNLILYIIFTISQANGFFGTTEYYIIYDSISLIFECTSLFIYIYPYFKMESTLKERDFLKLFSIVPIGIFICHIISFLVVLYPIDFLFNIFYSIPMDIILSIIGLYIIYTYFKNKTSVILIGIIFMYVLFQVSVHVLLPQEYVVETAYIKFLYSCINIFNTTNVFQILVFIPFLINIIFLKKYYSYK